MAFLVSPGVEVKEKDLTNIIPAVSTSIGGFAGLFEWGPALEATAVASEADLIAKFGYPRISSVAGSNSRLDWYSAANFLGYSNFLQTVRVLPEDARTASSEVTTVQTAAITAVMGASVSAVGVANFFYDGTNTVAVSLASGDALTTVATKFGAALTAAGVTGVTVDGITVSYDAGSYTVPASSTTSGGITVNYFSSTVANAGTSTNTAVISNYNDFLVEKESLVDGSVYARYVGELGNSIGVMIIDAGISASDFASTTIGTGNTTLADLFDDVPGTSVWGENNHNANLADEVHVVVYTTSDRITGVANDVLETYSFLSKAKNGKTADSGANYYVDVINAASQYIYMCNEETFATGAVSSVSTDLAIGTTLTSTSSGTFKSLITNNGVTGVRAYSLAGGSDGTDVADGDYTAAYDVLGDVEQLDVNLLITGSRSKTVQKYVIDIAETRKDCIAFVSPSYASAVTNPSAEKIVEYFNSSTDGFNSSSYAVFDSAWKRQYDRYNDEYFWIPVNADIAGLAARTDATNDAWWSPAGLNRGFIQNVVKLSYNPNQTDRDILYPKRVNPVVSLRGQGTLLFGDKTALSRPSAFDRINVRRLFIILEKAIATAAKYQLFEFNDDFTRRLFVNAVEPFLAEVRTRRGVYDFKVVCDTSNNTAEVIDGNRFVADIYIKPVRSINFINLNFVAVRSGVSFNEVVGA